jgi:COG4 transport protein
VIAQLVQERRKGTFDDNHEKTEKKPSTSQMLPKDAKVIEVVTEDDDEAVIDTEDDENSISDDDDDDDENNKSNNMKKATKVSEYHQYHGPVLTIILGEAATLIHPLLAWMTHLPTAPHHHPNDTTATIANTTATTITPMVQLQSYIQQLCYETIRILNHQTQILVKTVTDWLLEDRHIDTYWMTLFNTTIDVEQNHTRSMHDKDISHSSKRMPSAKKLLPRSHLISLDGLLEELSYSCQILDRYRTLIQSYYESKNPCSVDVVTNSSSNSVHDSITQVVIPQYVHTYTSLECLFALQQWQSALKHAAPITIVLGMEIQVPSVVEDAQYLSQRSLERATSTRSKYAIGTVAYSVCRSIWTTALTGVEDPHNNVNYTTITDTGEAVQQKSKNRIDTVVSIYQALLERRGCWKYQPTIEEQMAEDERQKRAKMIELGGAKTNKAPNSGDFATALLEALDDADNYSGKASKAASLGSKKNKGSNKTTMGKSPPPSGGGGGVQYLANLVMLSDRDRDKMIQKLIDTQFCVLNGFHAAHGACHSLIDFLEHLFYNDNENDEQNDTIGDEKQAHGMIQLAREELLKYSIRYKDLLVQNLQEVLVYWCGTSGCDMKRFQGSIKKNTFYSNNTILCFDKIRLFFENENYELDGQQIVNAENEERLHQELIVPFTKESILIQQLSSKCESSTVLELACTIISTTVVHIILDVLFKQYQHDANGNSAHVDSNNAMMQKKKRFTDWGAILLSTQIRMLQTFLTSTMLTLPSNLQQDSRTLFNGTTTSSRPMINNPTPLTALSATTNTTTVITPKLWPIWQKLSQVTSILQLERPSDWVAYQHQSFSASSSLLEWNEVAYILSLRKDFSKDAINLAMSTISKKT